MLKKKKLEVSCFLVSNYNTKLKLSKQYGVDTKTDTELSGKELNPEINPHIYG